MAIRQIKDAKDLSTNELIYFKGHAQATYMSDGRTVEDAINQIGEGEGCGGEVYLTPFTVEQFCTGNVNLTDEQRDELLNAASQNRIIGMPHDSSAYQAGYTVADFKYKVYNNDGLDSWFLELGVIYNGAHYTNDITSHISSNTFRASRKTITPFKPLTQEVIVEDGVAVVNDDLTCTDNCIFWVNGESTELYIYLEPSEIGKTIRFFTGESCALEIGVYVYWANGEVPTIEPYTNYELSLVANMEGAVNAVLTPFKPVE